MGSEGTGLAAQVSVGIHFRQKKNGYEPRAGVHPFLLHKIQKLLERRLYISILCVDKILCNFAGWNKFAICKRIMLVWRVVAKSKSKEHPEWRIFIRFSLDSPKNIHPSGIELAQDLSEKNKTVASTSAD